jgi:hypothetical protein
VKRNDFAHMTPSAGHGSHDSSSTEPPSNEAAAPFVACPQNAPASGCPGHGPSHCGLHPCCFWAPAPCDPLAVDTASGLLLSLIDLAPGNTTVDCHAAAVGSLENYAPFSPEALRQHLALSVLLI